jgi:hypothetical protein
MLKSRINSSDRVQISPDCEGDDQSLAGVRCFAGCECSSDQHRQFLYQDMQLTVQQSGAIYFKRHKGSKRRAALFRQLRASAADQTCDVKQQTFGNACIGQRLRSGQLWLKGFESEYAFGDATRKGGVDVLLRRLK